MNCSAGSIHLDSVVIPSKTTPDLLVEALESVFAQTYQNLEVIVVDDGSTPSLEPVLKSHYADRILFMRHEESLGAPVARNAGARLASGDFIAFLDDDDIWLPKKIEKQVSTFLTDNSICLVFCGEMIVCGEELIKQKSEEWPLDGPVRMLWTNLIGGTSVALVKRGVFLDLLFDEDLPSCQDWDLFLRMSRVGKFKGIPEVLVRRSIHGNQISGSVDVRLMGRMLFLDKHYREISRNAVAYCQHLRRIGVLSLLVGRKKSASIHFLKAIRTSIFDARNWICFLVSIFLPVKIAGNALSIYAVTRAKNYRQYC
jgi:glycosyltransferase involved in cell wall biosynthesis